MSEHLLGGTRSGKQSQPLKVESFDSERHNDTKDRATLNIIAAVALNGVIGKDNKVPWRLPADFQYFKDRTKGQTVLFGRNAYRSIIDYYEWSGRPIPYGKIIVLSNSLSADTQGITVIRSPQEAVDMAQTENIWVAGGASVYEAFLDLADKLYISWVDANIDGDSYFPTVDDSFRYEKVSNDVILKDERNIYNVTRSVYERKY